MKTATKVTACRIKEPPENAKDPSASWEETLALYKEGEQVEISASQIEQFREVLTVPSTYMLGVEESCIPSYGVRLRFEGQPEAIDVNLCFECKILAVVRAGHIVGGEDFDGGASKLAVICKELFPGDPEIQALKP